MARYHRQALVVGLKLFDLASMTLAFTAASLATLDDLEAGTVGNLLAARIKVANALLFAGLLVAWYLTCSACGLYRSRRLSAALDVARDVLAATTLGTMVIAAAGVAFRVKLVTPVFMAAFWLLTTALALGGRLVLRAVLARVRRHGRNLRNVLIVGTNPRAVRFAERIDAERELGYQVTGFADDAWEGLDGFRQGGRELVAGLEDVPAFLRTHVVDEVVIALPVIASHARVAAILAACEEQGIIARLLSDTLFAFKLAHATTEDFHDETVITVSRGAMAGWHLELKRLIDVVLSAVLLVVLSPLLLLVAAWIKLADPGPVLFVQERVGLNKRPFRLYKFRTMVPDAEARLAEVEHLNEVDGAAFKLRSDPRITKLGRFLRRTSIDELPQLLNVLRGDMSLVGPRPLPFRDFRAFQDDAHRRRFTVRPGITGLWQVSGRSNVSFDRWMELDLSYIDHWSLLLDLKILARTVGVVLRGTGAT